MIDFISILCPFTSLNGPSRQKWDKKFRELLNVRGNGSSLFQHRSRQYPHDHSCYRNQKCPRRVGRISHPLCAKPKPSPKPISRAKVSRRIVAPPVSKCPPANRKDISNSYPQ